MVPASSAFYLSLPQWIADLNMTFALPGLA